MVQLYYVGALPSVSNDLINIGEVNGVINATTPNQSSLADSIPAMASSTYVSKSAVDNLAAPVGTLETPSYYTTQDALNLPWSAVVPSGVAVGTTELGTTNYYGVPGLDSHGRVSASQIPLPGAGIILGPFGTAATYSVTASNTPLRLADWNLQSVLNTAGLAEMQFRPLVFMSLFVTGYMAQPVVEVRIANSTSAVSYSASTLIAQGLGRNVYNDYHAVTVLPVGDANGESYPALLPTNYSVWVSAWVYDLNGNSVSCDGGRIAGAALYLLRGSQ